MNSTDLTVTNIKQKSNNNNSESALSQKLNTRKLYIHQSLCKLGCNLMPTSYNNNSLNIFMQASDSRLQLIQWLIAVIYPGYKLDAEYRNVYQDDPHIMVIRRLSCILWKIGVMPVTKYTKNLDYDKYVQGLVGQQSSVNLIYDLCQLAIAKFSPALDSKLQKNLGQLLGQLIRNNAELVNVNYDPYGITFPAKYYQQSNNSKEGEYEKSVSLVNQMYDKLVAEFQQKSKLKQQIQAQRIKNRENKGENDDIENSKEQPNFEQIVSEVQSFKQLFGRKYEKLSQSIDKFIQKYDKIVPQDCKQVSQLHNSRLLQIPKSLSKAHNSYKNMITNMESQTFNSQPLLSLQNQVSTYLNSLNETLL